MQEPEFNPVKKDTAVSAPPPAKSDRAAPDPEGSPASMETRSKKPSPKGMASLAVTVLCAAAGVILWSSLYFGGEAEPDPPYVDVPPVSTSASTTAQRVLRSWEGKLALFTGDGTTPDEVYDVYIQSLPPEEQDRLNQGIVIHTDEELASWLEDYTS